MRVDELSGEDFYRQPKEASMTDKIDTSTLGRIDLTSGKSPAPIEECVSTWAVDDLIERLRHEAELSRKKGGFILTRHFCLLTEAADRIESLIADNERLREALTRLASPVRFEYQFVYEFGARCRFAKAALSHKDMT